MNGNARRVSICVPTYRGAAFLPATIESVLSQTYPHWELWIVDDCSPDETADIVTRYPDPRVRYARNERNLRPQGNWNRCLELAEGEYFKLLPHDDLLHPCCLARQVAVLDADGERKLSFTFCARDIVGPEGRVLARRGYPRRGSGEVASAEGIRRCVRAGTNLFGEPGGLLFRTALARTVGSFDATNPYVIDLDYWFRLLAHGAAYYIDERLVSFRVSPVQWSVALGGKQSSDFNAFVGRASAQLGLSLSPSDVRIGRAAARLNEWLRLILYMVYFRTSKSA